MEQVNLIRLVRTENPLTTQSSCGLSLQMIVD